MNLVSVGENKYPFFSVIICTYNRQNLLLRAINSLQKQKEQDWECIIVDDGSNDNTSEIAREICKNNSKFRYIFHSNRKVSYSRNVGILASAGAVVTFLDSDDEYAEDHLSIRKELILQNPEMDLLHGGVKIIGNQYVADRKNPKKKIHLSDCVIGGTFFIKKEKAIQIGAFDNINYGDDAVFFEKAVKAGFLIGKIDIQSYIYYRDSPDSLCNNI
jgi:glycosyltransferase involved in cell wall biosynthesis